PEFARKFQLHFFSVDPDLVIEDSLLIEKTSQSVQPKSLSHSKPPGILVPVHPWEANYLKSQPEVQREMAAGRIIEFGPTGEFFQATSSVRTLYSSEVEFFYKLSLHIRITNCIRRNVLSEMKSSLELSRVISNLPEEFRQKFGNFKILLEPGYLTVGSEGKEIEGFGLILRESIGGETPEKTLVVAASLFGNRKEGIRYLNQFLEKSGMSPEVWWKCYLDQLVAPVFHLYFHYGLMSEPHLQNTVVILKKGVPAGVALRDLDGFKAVEGTWTASQISAREVCKDLLFSPDEAWNRLLYCLIVNHLAEAAAVLSLGSAEGERRLWMILNQYLADLSLPGFPSIPVFPAKGNLVTRFRRATDRASSYFDLKNPVLREAGNA
ncbi:MAG: hypothetical protein HYX67_16990, partial [Candidatus Melainabacteria bacterium]|nr:hypothetical protein [Candidatus Melainabacteria bacterium]